MKKLKIMEDYKGVWLKKTRNRHGAGIVEDNSGIRNLGIGREPWDDEL